MPHRCVVFGCSNEPSEEIVLHRIPYANDDRLEAKKRRKAWVDFVKTKRAKWEPSTSSVVCSRHFKPDDFMTRLSRPFVAPGEKALIIKPRLKTDDFGICVCPSITFPDKDDQTLSARDRRRIVSKIVSFIYGMLFFVFYFSK